MWEQMNPLLSVLPQGVHWVDGYLDSVEEIRFVKGKPIRLRGGKKDRELPILVDECILQGILDRSTERSPHGVMEMLKKGYLILPGGHRLGLCGTGVYKEGRLSTLREISSINIRIARNVHHFGRSVADTLWKAPGSALCMGPPGRGKTTLLRDIIWQLSTRYGERIAVVDERLELGASIDGCPQFDLGPTIDIMSSVRKPEAIDMLIRTMGPTWIALDEITAEEDVEAIIRASYCGVRFIATAHGNGLADLRTRPIYRKLLSSNVFRYLFLIDPHRNIHKEELCKCSV